MTETSEAGPGPIDQEEVPTEETFDLYLHPEQEPLLAGWLSSAPPEWWDLFRWVVSTLDRDGDDAVRPGPAGSVCLTLPVRLREVLNRLLAPHGVVLVGEVDQHTGKAFHAIAPTLSGVRSSNGGVGLHPAGRWLLLDGPSGALAQAIGLGADQMVNLGETSVLFLPDDKLAALQRVADDLGISDEMRRVDGMIIHGNPVFHWVEKGAE